MTSERERFEAWVRETWGIEPNSKKLSGETAARLECSLAAWEFRAALNQPPKERHDTPELEAIAKRLFDENKDSHAAPWEQQWVKTKQLWREQARQELATPEPAQVES